MGKNKMKTHQSTAKRFRKTASGKILRTSTFGPYAAVIPEVSGDAHITGRNEFLIDPDDPLKDGFILR